jgi:hypothetical protein
MVRRIIAAIATSPVRHQLRGGLAAMTSAERRARIAALLARDEDLALEKARATEAMQAVRMAFDAAWDAWTAALAAQQAALSARIDNMLAANELARTPTDDDERESPDERSNDG